MPLRASPALGNGAANPQGSLCRDRSSFFPQAVTQPNADARSLYLSRCYFWPLSWASTGSRCCGWRDGEEAPASPLAQEADSVPWPQCVPGSRTYCPPPPRGSMRGTPKEPPSCLLSPARHPEISLLLGGCLVLGHLQQQLTLSPVVTSKEFNSD